MIRTLFASTARGLVAGIALGAAMAAPAAAQQPLQEQQSIEPQQLPPQPPPPDHQAQPQPQHQQAQPQPPPFHQQYRQQGYQPPQQPGYQPYRKEGYQQPYHEAAYRRDCYWTGSAWGYNSHGKVLVCRPYKPQGYGWVWHTEGAHHGWYHPQRRRWHYSGFHH